MYFSNSIIYKFKQQPAFIQSEFEKLLEQDTFRHCSSQELSTFGWAKALGKYSDTLSHFSNRKILVRARREEKLLPAAVINEVLAEKVEVIEQEENRPVKKKERDELKENVITTLLPQAFTKSSFIEAFIDMDNGYFVVNTTSFSKAEELAALLRKSLGSLPIVPAFVHCDLDVHLTEWLTNNTTPKNFAIGHNVEMQEPDDKAATVSLKGHELACDEVKTHLDNGKRVTKLALTWNESITFSLQIDGAIKSITYSDTFKERNADIPAEDMAIKLDADFVLVAGDLIMLLTELLANLHSAEEEQQPDIQHTTLADFQDVNGNDALYAEAVSFIKETGSVSVSRIQRKFRIGYNRAARLVEQLERDQVVSEPGHNGQREILIHK